MIVYLFSYTDAADATDCGHLGIFTSVQEGISWLNTAPASAWDAEDKETTRVHVFEVKVNVASYLPDDPYLGMWFYDEDGDEWVRSE